MDSYAQYRKTKLKVLGVKCPLSSLRTGHLSVQWRWEVRLTLRQTQLKQKLILDITHAEGIKMALKGFCDKIWTEVGKIRSDCVGRYNTVAHFFLQVKTAMEKYQVTNL